MVRHTSKKVKATCGRKTAYKTRTEASAAMHALIRQDGARMSVYRCSVGMKGTPRHWHVGRRRSRWV